MVDRVVVASGFRQREPKAVMRLRRLRLQELIRSRELERTYRNRLTHDPRDLNRARELAMVSDHVRLGVFYRNETNVKYEDTRRTQARTVQERIGLLNAELDKYAV